MIICYKLGIAIAFTQQPDFIIRAQKMNNIYLLEDNLSQ